MLTPPADRSIDDRRTAADQYNFRNLHPHVRFGTASDRYAGWIGQIYPEDPYATRLSTRTRKLAGQSFEERQVPIESVRFYFQHFDVLELDFTFYRPLLEDGESSPNYFVLSNYLDHAPDEARFLLKAPQKFFARTLRRGGDFVENPDFLDAEGYVETFHEPAVELLGDQLDGLIFQQEYQRVAERGLGHVFSHWTWLPAIRKQWSMCGERFTASNDQVVARLLTPRNMKYADAYATAHPFDAPVAELSETQQAHDMVLDATALAFQAEAQNATLNVIANNRAWGNAPDLARTIAHRILDEEERRQ